MKLSSAAIEALRSTLHMVEQRCGLAPDDPGLLELKRILLNRIAELEAAEVIAEQSGQAASDVAAENSLAAEPPLSESGEALPITIDLPVSLLADSTPTQSAALGQLPELPKVLSGTETQPDCSQATILGTDERDAN